MSGNVSDIQKIRELQATDKAIDEAMEELKSSPYMKKIGEVRLKKAQYKEKRDQVDKVYVKARAEFEQITNKDSELAQAQKDIQKKIEETKGDYRKVEDFTNKLNEITNNRKIIDEKLVKVESNYNKLNELRNKLDGAIEKVSMVEDDLNAKLSSANTSAQIAYNDNVSKRNKLRSEISDDALKMYDKARSIVGNVVVADLQTNMCSICRNNFSPVMMEKIKKQAPISTCPNCQRLLVVS